MSSQPLISNSDLTELRMWSMTQGFKPGVTLPEKYRPWVEAMVKDEMVLCCNKKSMDTITSKISGGFSTSVVVVEFHNRRDIEYCTDAIQFVTGCCIHTKKTMIALRIIRTTPWVDGYHPNSITVPEGHSDAPLGEEWKGWASKFREWGDRYVVQVQDLQRFLAVNAEREVTEEIRHPDETAWKSFCLWLDYAIQNEAARKVIYLNSGTTSPRHLDTVFTVDASNAPYGIADMIDNHEFISGEPEKHEVIYLDKDSIGTYGPNNFGEYLTTHFFESDLPKLFYPDQFN